MLTVTLNFTKITCADGGSYKCSVNDSGVDTNATVMLAIRRECRFCFVFIYFYLFVVVVVCFVLFVLSFFVPLQFLCELYNARFTVTTTVVIAIFLSCSLTFVFSSFFFFLLFPAVVFLTSLPRTFSSYFSSSLLYSFFSSTIFVVFFFALT